MLRYRIVMILLFVFASYANTSQNNMDWLTKFNIDTQTRDATIKWVIQREKCLTKEKQSKALFPTNTWFNALSKDDKIKIVLYFNGSRLQACSEQESLQLKSLVDEGEHNELREILTTLGAFDWPSEKELEGFDTHEIKNISEHVEMFNLRTVGKQLKFLD